MFSDDMERQKSRILTATRKVDNEYKYFAKLTLGQKFTRVQFR